MSMLTLNPLTQTEPERPKCEGCKGVGNVLQLMDFDSEPIVKCPICGGSGHAPPPRCEACEGTGYWEYDTDGPLVVGGNGEKCPACSGTGYAPWEVMIVGDVFSCCPVTAEPDICEYEPYLSDQQLARLFATIAANSDMQFYLPVDSVASAKRAREWIEDDGTKLRMPFYFSEIKEDGQQWPGWPLPNLTILAVAHDQPSLDHDQPSLDSVLPAVLAIPAAAHGMWLKGVTGAVDLSLRRPRGQAFQGERYGSLKHDISILLISHDVPGGEAATFTASPESSYSDSDDEPPAAGELPPNPATPQEVLDWLDSKRLQRCIEQAKQQARAAGVRVVEL